MHPQTHDFLKENSGILVYGVWKAAICGNSGFFTSERCAPPSDPVPSSTCTGWLRKSGSMRSDRSHALLDVNAVGLP